jgi:hypothetical protein
MGLKVAVFVGALQQLGARSKSGSEIRAHLALTRQAIYKNNEVLVQQNAGSLHAPIQQLLLRLRHAQGDRRSAGHADRRVGLFVQLLPRRIRMHVARGRLTRVALQRGGDALGAQPAEAAALFLGGRGRAAEVLGWVETAAVCPCTLHRNTEGRQGGGGVSAQSQRSRMDEEGLISMIGWVNKFLTYSWSGLSARTAPAAPAAPAQAQV